MRELEMHRENLDGVTAVYCGMNRMTEVNRRFDRSEIESGSPISAEHLLLADMGDSVRLYAFPRTIHGIPWIRLENGELRAGIEYDGRGEPREELIRREFPDAAAALRSTISPLPVRRGKHGWCSWYHYYTGIDEGNLRENLRMCAARPEIQVFQIDMGYSRYLGDWFTPGNGFSAPITEIIREVARAGMVPGVWLAPFTAETESELYTTHPDWFYADDEYPWKRSQPAWKCMDLSVPEALDFLVGVVRQLHHAGARYFKLDFLDMALVEGRRKNTETGGVGLYRHALATLRAAAPDSYVLGCNPLFSASLDVVDALRTGEDTAPRWNPTKDKLASARRSLRTGLARTYLRSSIEVDLDCMLLRASDSDLSSTEIRTFARAVAASGEQRFLSDDMAAVPEAAIEEAFRPMPYDDRVLIPARPLQEDEPSDFDIYSGGERIGKLICNWGDGEVCIVPALAFGPEASGFRNAADGAPLGGGEICLQPHESLLAFRS